MLAIKAEYTFDFAALLPEYSEHKLEMQLYLTALVGQVELPDEMLAILSDRNRIMQKKGLESTNAKWNEYMNERNMNGDVINV